MKKKIYLSPRVDVVDVNIEKGFARSVFPNDYADDGEAGMLQEGESYDWQNVGADALAKRFKAGMETAK